MRQIRFSQHSKPRQFLVRTCQRVNHGAILNVAVANGEIDLDNPPDVVVDFHLANDVVARGELDLTDFILPAETCRLLAQIDSLQEGLLEKITVFDGTPRRVCDEAIEACLQTINKVQCERPGRRSTSHELFIVLGSGGQQHERRTCLARVVAGLGSQRTAEPAGDWREGLIQNERGIKACLQNALVALERAPEWKGVLHFNESALQVVAKAPPPWDSRPFPFPWSDEDDVRTAAWMQQQGIMVSKEIAGQAIQTVARKFGFHPIRDYLNALEWDGTVRIDDWLTLYLSADTSDYARAAGAKWLIGAVARIFKPGCKNDTCLVFEGPQGLLKSTALRALATPWFTDEISDLGTKDAAMQVRGVWIIELAELAAMGRPEDSRGRRGMAGVHQVTRECTD
jgi:hypothetical protein